MRRSWLIEFSSAARSLSERRSASFSHRRRRQFGPLQGDRALVQQGRPTALFVGACRRAALRRRRRRRGRAGPPAAGTSSRPGAGCRCRRRRPRPSPRPSGRRRWSPAVSSAGRSARRRPGRDPRPWAAAPPLARRTRPPSCSARAWAVSSWLVAAESRRLAASRAVTAEARRAVAKAWSRTRPVSQPVATATAMNTTKVRTSVAWPMTKVKPRLQEEEIVGQDRQQRRQSAPARGRRRGRWPSTLARKIIARSAPAGAAVERRRDQAVGDSDQADRGQIAAPLPELARAVASTGAASSSGAAGVGDDVQRRAAPTRRSSAGARRAAEQDRASAVARLADHDLGDVVAPRVVDSTASDMSSPVSTTVEPPSCSASFRLRPIAARAGGSPGGAVRPLDVGHGPGRVHHHVGTGAGRRGPAAPAMASPRSAPGCARPPPTGPRRRARRMAPTSWSSTVWAARRRASSRRAVRFSGLKKLVAARRAVSGT